MARAWPGTVFGIVGRSADRAVIHIYVVNVLPVAIHGVKTFDPDLTYWMDNGATGKMAYPTLAILAVAVRRHRARVTVLGNERDWSPLRRTRVTRGLAA